VIARFRSGLYFEDLNAGGGSGIRLKLTKPLVYDSATLGRTVGVPKGFITDLASIPRVLWNVLPPIGAYDAAAVVHDYLYRTGGCTRAQADRVLYEAMIALKVDALQARIIYAGVMVGGWKSWNAYRAKGAA
jgi:uncharacterized protein DUF1353